ncbi:hypothetical protein HanRHA438_Chr15g0712231 [Helianthus annuus]|nr:hypothetical protein HanIR_Chr15g0761241 [Helianthus annuus]KAJ0845318.1 hypothetical protein HanRHA438_Chr15g0712231 [Helianthus annuus]
MSRPPIHPGRNREPRAAKWYRWLFILKTLQRKFHQDRELGKISEFRNTGFYLLIDGINPCFYKGSF